MGGEIFQSRHKWKRMRNWVLFTIAKYTLPYVYLLYIRLVWMTSKVTYKTDVLKKYLFEVPPYNTVCPVWHQDVFCVAWAYRKFQPTTMASVGDAGEIISRMLKLCKYRRIWRGGTSKGKKRHKKILDDFIADFKEAKHAVAGITVDGSNGPAYRLKRGVIVIAQECGCPLVLTRIWCQKRILLPTWDRTLIPLPFNKIVVYMQGPYYVPKNLTPDEFEKFRLYIENEFLEFTYHIFQLIDKRVPPECLKFFPDGWNPSCTKD